THEELTERCALYRRLIVSGEYDDESVRTVEDVLDDRAMAAAAATAPGAGRVPQTRYRAAANAAAGPVAGALARLPPAPELLAQVDALSPANDKPQVDVAAARAGDRHFTLRRLLRPLTAALIIGLLLDGLDALAGLALPALVRNGIDHGVETKAFHA